MKPFEGRKRRWSDRKDGFKVRNLDPMGRIIPFIMKDKGDSWVLFEEKVDITHVQDFVRQKRREDMPNLSLYHVLFASIVRAISQVPQINRFVQNNTVYARNEIKIGMVVKRGLQHDSDRTMITPRFECDATLQDVINTIEADVQSINTDIKDVTEDANKTGLDALEILLDHLPNWLLRFVVWLLKWLDRHGWIPKKLTDLSPFHSSVCITNMGSFGMESVYHHCYEFGTLSIFGALGNKTTEYVPQKDGSVKKKTFLNLKFVIDERITDGYIYGLAFHQILSCFTHPEKLLTPPEKVVEDIIDRKKK